MAPSRAGAAPGYTPFLLLVVSGPVTDGDLGILRDSRANLARGYRDPPCSHVRTPSALSPAVVNAGVSELIEAQRETGKEHKCLTEQAAACANGERLMACVPERAVETGVGFSLWRTHPPQKGTCSR
jgi:hypothetical protein